MHDTHSPELARLAEYLTGDLSDADVELVERWLADRPERAAFVARLRAMRDTAEIADSLAPRVQAMADALAVARAQSALLTAAHPHAHAPSVAPTRPTRRSIRLPRLALYATVAALGVLAIAITGRRVTSPVSSAVQAQYATRTAQRATITLTDGTRVTLAPQTTLAVETGFGNQTRTVRLTGEAYFEVASATGAPFIVRTGNVQTRVIGTAFSVRQYLPDDTVRIAVATGKVVAMGRGTSRTVSAGFVASVTDSSAVVTAADVGHYTDWVRGRLVFERAPIRVVLATVGRWYGYDFRMVDTSSTNEKISVAFNVDDPQDMLAVLKDMLDVTLTFHGSEVVLTPRRDAARPSKFQKTPLNPRMEVGR